MYRTNGINNEYAQILEYIIANFHNHKCNMNKIKHVITCLVSVFTQNKKNKSKNDMLVYSIRKIIRTLTNTIQTKDDIISKLLIENTKLKTQQNVTQIIPNKYNAILVTLFR